MIDPWQFGTIAVSAKKLCLNNNLVDHTEKSSQWTVLAGNTTYSPMLFSDTCVFLSQQGLHGVDEGQMHLTLHSLQKDTPFSLGGGPVSLPVGTSPPLLPKSSDLSFWFLHFYQFLRWALSCTILWAGMLLWCGSCSFRTLLLGSCNLRCHCCHPQTILLQVKTIVVSLTATDEMASKPSPPASFSEGFFLVLANIGIMCW